MALVMEDGRVELYHLYPPSGPHRACNRIALLLLYNKMGILCKIAQRLEKPKIKISFWEVIRDEEVVPP
jgi:hypothetical protein